MNFISDHNLDGTQHLASVRGEQEIQGFRSRDQNVGGMARKAGPFGCRRISGTNGWMACEKYISIAGQLAQYLPVARAGCVRRPPPMLLSAKCTRTRQRFMLSGAGVNMMRLMHHKKAARVLPVPVGARMRVDSPRAIAGHPAT